MRTSFLATTRIDCSMDDFLTKALAERRSLEQALADLRSKYERQPNPDLAKMIRELEAEISYRNAVVRNGRVSPVEKPRRMCSIREEENRMRKPRFSRPTILPLKDDMSVKEVFADHCAGLNVLNGNVHITFASVVADHSEDPAPSRRIVSARVVMPIAGITELRDILGQMAEALSTEDRNEPPPTTPTTVTPFRKQT